MKEQKLSVGADDPVCPKYQRNTQKGIALIALTITIIILLILAVVSIRLVNNGILGKAEHAVNKYQEKEIEEQIKLEYAEWQTAQFAGETRTAAEFMQAKLREILSDNKLTVTEDNGKFTVIFSDETEYEYNKSTGVVEEKVYTYIKKSTAKEDSYVGCFADIDKDGTVDGVIFVDLLTGSVRDTQQWGNSNGAYTLPTDVTVDNVNTYYVSQSNYTDTKFGTHEVISPKTTNGKQRFYIMQLSDFTTPAKIDGTEAENYPAYTLYCWYQNAFGKMNASDTSVNFEAGKTNTGKMIEIWNAAGTENGYTDSAQGKQDIWKHIQTKYNEGWFIPSRAEWAAFANELKISSNYNSTFGLSKYYWSSSQYNANSAWSANFNRVCMGSRYVGHNGYVRMAATF